MTCPKCGEEDYIQYVFVLHCSVTGLVETKNPSDDHWLYRCPNNHIYDENQKPLEEN